MKILNICSVPATYPGGSEKVILELSKILSKNNDITILQTDLYEEGKHPKESKIGTIKVITCKNDKFLGGYGYSKEFKKKLKEIWKNFDVVHVYGYGRFTSNFSINFLKGKKPLVFSAHGFFHDKKNNFFKKVHNILFARLLKKVDYCIGLTEIEKEKYKSFGVDKNKIKVIPGGVDLKDIPKKNLKQLRKKYVNGNKDPIMLYVGRIHESKGLQYAIKSIRDIKIKFIIAGKDAGFTEELRKISLEEGVKNKIVFLGQVTDKELEELYYLADFSILFSSWEGFGIVVIESMNAGKPVIVSDKGSLPLIVKDGKNGFIVEYPNVQKLKEKVLTLSKNKNLRQRMGKNAKIYSKKFGWENISNEHLKIYKKIRGLNG